MVAIPEYFELLLQGTTESRATSYPVNAEEFPALACPGGDNYIIVITSQLDVGVISDLNVM